MPYRPLRFHPPRVVRTSRLYRKNFGAYTVYPMLAICVASKSEGPYSELIFRFSGDPTAGTLGVLKTFGVAVVSVTLLENSSSERDHVYEPRALTQLPRRLLTETCSAL